MDLLRLLSDGEIHSGEELGAQLGISRAAIWKQIAAIKQRGIVVDVIPGRGYRLAHVIEWWDGQQIMDALSDRARGLLGRLIILERVSSTNDVLMELMRAEPRSGVICLAEEQTSGRGRRGREWCSPRATNFYGSVAWTFNEGISVVEGLSLAIGVAVMRALSRYGVKGAGLKWPNDIVAGDAKVGGVLIELQAEAAGPCHVVIGLGLNFALPEETKRALLRPTTDISTLIGSRVRRNVLGAMLIDEILCLLDTYTERGFGSVIAEWEAADAWSGKEVVVSGLENDLTGIACGIDDHGALRLKVKDGFRYLHGGEISLREQVL